MITVFYVYSAPVSDIPTDKLSNVDIKIIPSCPHILRPEIECENSIPTFLTFNSKLCRGCPRCDLPIGEQTKEDV
ncbi:hypothetical protein I4U23_005462 [Adineta vaga]|nr:hypothetical protein I4U23_005462 [Adineta vaga]